MAKKKRRKPLSEQWYTEEYAALAKQKTVRMRTAFENGWMWEAYLAGRWLRSVRFLSCAGAERSGKAWANRMGYTPKWE